MLTSYSIEQNEAKLKSKDINKNTSSKYKVKEQMYNKKGFRFSKIDIQETFLKSISVKKKLGILINC